MRILANENVPGAAITALRNRGHDVAWVREVEPGAAESNVIVRATAENRLLVTFDKDFGELVFQMGERVPYGIVLFRVPTGLPTQVAETMVKVLESRSDWAGAFSVVGEVRLRMTPLPR